MQAVIPLSFPKGRTVSYAITVESPTQANTRSVSTAEP